MNNNINTRLLRRHESPKNKSKLFQINSNYINSHITNNNIDFAYASAGVFNNARSSMSMSPSNNNNNNNNNHNNSITKNAASTSAKIAKLKAQLQSQEKRHKS